MNHWIHLQALLLRSQTLRDACRNHPENLPWPSPPTPSDLDWFHSLSWNQLEKQANGLLRKRLHEVSRLLPHTKKNLSESFSKAFLDYAESFWPTTYQRHWIDAAQFLKHLKPQYSPQLDPLEAVWIPFVAENRRFKIYFLLPSPHAFLPIILSFPQSYGILILWRFHGSSHYRYWASRPIRPELNPFET